MKKELESLLRREFKLSEDDVIVNVKVITERKVTGEYDLMSQKGESTPRAADEPRSKRKYTRRADKVHAPGPRKAGRKIEFDLSITTAETTKAKERLQKLAWQKKLTEEEEGRYEGLCKHVDVENLTVGQKDKIIALYKDVGRRITGLEEE